MNDKVVILHSPDKDIHLSTYSDTPGLYRAWYGTKKQGYIEASLEGKTLVLEDIRVAPSLRRKGIGRRLVRALLDYTGATIVEPEFIATEAGKGFFESLSKDIPLVSDWKDHICILNRKEVHLP